MDKYDSGIIYIVDIACALENDYDPYLESPDQTAPIPKQQKDEYDPSNFIVEQEELVQEEVQQEEVKDQVMAAFELSIGDIIPALRYMIV